VGVAIVVMAMDAGVVSDDVESVAGLELVVVEISSLTGS
jgi:hypothetical protein